MASHHWKVAAIICLIVLLSTSIAVDAPNGETEEMLTDPVDEYVVTLTGETFSDFVDQKTRTLVEFYAPWCGHCKALAPKYEEAARILKEETESSTILAKVDATKAPQISQQFKIEGYPTLYLIEGKETVLFDGGRETKDIVDWVLKHDMPAFKVLTYDEFESLRQTKIDLDTESSKEFEIIAFVKKGSKRGTV